MNEVRINQIDYKIYVTLTDAGIPVSSVQPSDIVVRYTLDGGPLLLDFLTVLDWQEIDPLDAPGLYLLTFRSAWTAQTGPLYVRLTPLGLPNFDPVVLDARIIPLTLTDLQTGLTRLLGLSQENFRMDDHVYNIRGELTSARVSIYASAADTLADNAPIAEYDIAASYDGQGRLLLYTMTQA